MEVEKEVMERVLEGESTGASEAAVVVCFSSRWGQGHEACGVPGRSCSLLVTLTALDGSLLERRALTLATRCNGVMVMAISWCLQVSNEPSSDCKPTAL